jgi:hypothetical protein
MFSRMVFERDPASMGSAATVPGRRPVRNDALLNRHRVVTMRLPAAGDELKTKDFEVRRSAVSDIDAGETDARPGAVWQLGDLDELRSDELAAAQVYLRLKEFFDRRRAYELSNQGKNPFLHPVPRLVGIPRAQLPRSPDCKAVNALVRHKEDGQGKFVELQVRFGAAQLTRRTEHVRGASRRAEPMGLAVDERWAWHEFGHVLVYAATDQLELPFSHGVGDALAAVIGDPDSELHDDPAWAGLTYPFVRLNRRHDRPASLGWCFCGRRSGLRALGGKRPMKLHADYFEEQLFSTALFRLYQSLGGATRDDRATRWSASDYVVFLIMVAIDKVNPTTLLAADFVKLLIDADKERASFDIEATWPGEDSRPVQRKGGRVGKVIRWAFEQQGLVPDLPINEVHEGVAPPPKVDVYIRARAKIRHDGGYAPVPLRWREEPQLPWHAEGISVQGAEVVVQVRDRGVAHSEAVTVHAWWAALVGNGNPLAWKPLAPQNANSDLEFRFEQPKTDGRYWVFAEASCKSDASNLNVGSKPPSAADELMELVAHDNNCGLALLGSA